MTQETEQQDGRSYVPVRDRRGKNWYWKLNALHDPIQFSSGEVTTWAAILGPTACAVYDNLCRRADEETQTCFPAIPTIAWEIGASDPVVTNSLHILVHHGLIAKQNRVSDEGDPTSNIYVLLPLENWRLEGGNLSLLPPKVQKEQEGRLAKAKERKAPRRIRERFLGGKRERPQVVNSDDHPGKLVLLPPPNVVSYPGKQEIPPLEQASSGASSSESSSSHHEAPNTPPTENTTGSSDNDGDVEKVESAIAPQSPPQQNEVPGSMRAKTQPQRDAATSDLIERFGKFNLPENDAARLLAAREWPAAFLADDGLKAALNALGVHDAGPKSAKAILAKAGAAKVRWELVMWPHRPEATNPKIDNKAGMLISFIVAEGQAPPAGYVESLIARVQGERKAEADARESEERTQSEAAKHHAAEAERERLDAAYYDLSDAERREVDAEVTAKLGKFGESAAGAVGSWRREVMRGRLNHERGEISAMPAVGAVAAQIVPPSVPTANGAALVNGATNGNSSAATNSVAHSNGVATSGEVSRAKGLLLGRVLAGADLDDLDAHRGSVGHDLTDEQWSGVIAEVRRSFARAA